MKTRGFSEGQIDNFLKNVEEIEGDKEKMKYWKKQASPIESY